MVFGDSWGSFSKDQFEMMFIDHGHPEITVDNVAIGGTTASFWATMPNSLSNAVDDNPDCEWVWLSIGGNDGKPVPLALLLPFLPFFISFLSSLCFVSVI